MPPLIVREPQDERKATWYGAIRVHTGHGIEYVPGCWTNRAKSLRLCWGWSWRAGWLRLFPGGPAPRAGRTIFLGGALFFSPPAGGGAPPPPAAGLGGFCG